jgi:hypothetical protein
VPYLTESATWKYGTGTSYSAPYLSAAAIIVNYGFTKGYFEMSCNTYNLATTQIFDFLRFSASSSDSFKFKYGYGYVDIFKAYERAYRTGLTDGQAQNYCGSGGSYI